jgi:hypothetical protein
VAADIRLAAVGEGSMAVAFVHQYLKSEHLRRDP